MKLKCMEASLQHNLYLYLQDSPYTLNLLQHSTAVEE